MQPQYFEFSRFVRVLRYTWATQPVLPYWSMLAVAILGWFAQANELRALVFTGNTDFYVMFFMIFLTVCGGMYAGLLFREFGRTTTSIQYLLLPATVLEKWLAKILLAGLVFPLLATLAFVMLQKIYNLLSAPLYAVIRPELDFRQPETLYVYSLFYILLPCMVVSALIWKRFSLFKGLLALALLAFVSFQITALFSSRLNTTDTLRPLAFELVPPFVLTDQSVELKQLIWTVWTTGTYIPAALMLAASYFLLKEKEI